jgi:hypothetical protein
MKPSDKAKVIAELPVVPPPVPTVVFGVVKQGRDYIPTRFVVQGDKVLSSEPCAPIGPYVAIAYQYASHALLGEYVRMTSGKKS